MNTTNRPMDVLLNVETVQPTDRASANKPLTDSNKRENSFDQVLAKEQASSRERDDRVQRQRDDRTAPEKPADAAHREEPRKDTPQQATRQEKPEGSDGKELPQQQPAVTAKPKEEKTSTEEATNPLLVLDTGESGEQAKQSGTHQVVTEKNHSEATATVEEVKVAKPATDLDPDQDLDLEGEAVQALTGKQREVTPEQPKEGAQGAQNQPQKADVEIVKAVVSTVAPVTEGKETPAAATVVVPGNRQELTAARQSASKEAGDTSDPRLARLRIQQGELTAGDLAREAVTKPEQAAKSAPDIDLVSVKQVFAGLNRNAKPDSSIIDKQQLLADNQAFKTAVTESAAVPGSAAKTASGQGSEAPLHRIQSLVQSLQGTGLQRGVAGTSPPATGLIQVPVGTPDWGQAIGQRVALLASQGVKSAELQLNPQELGPVNVKISVTNDQANVSFTSHHAGVREALEVSINRLREMMENQGLNLVDVDVSDQSQANEQSEEQLFGQNTKTGNNAGLPGRQDSESGGEPVVIGNSLVDYYA